MPKSSGGWKASRSPTFLPEGLRAVTVEHGPTREQFVRAVQRRSNPCFVTGLLKAFPALNFQSLTFRAVPETGAASK